MSYKIECKAVRLLSSFMFRTALRLLSSCSLTSSFQQQIPMLAVGWSLGSEGMGPTAKRAFIGGGGELATARELLKHASIEEVVMVDLDPMVVEVATAQLPEWGDGCLNDPRLTVSLAEDDMHHKLIFFFA